MSNSTDTSRATRFIAAFNDIERYLREDLNARNSDGFSWMVRLSRKKHRLTAAQADTLLAFAELRNAITHGEYNGGKPIADPHENVCEDIERLRGVLIRIPEVLQILSKGKVETVELSTPCTDVLALVRTTNFNQFPVYVDGSYRAMLTTATIAKWVASDVGDNNHLDASTVADILPYGNDSGRGVLSSRRTTVPEALEILSKRDHSGHTPVALVITEHGKASERPLTIIVPGDLPDLLEAVDF